MCTYVIYSLFQNGTCQDWMFKCKNERCIPFWWKCDQADDCGDGSDEIGCTQNSLVPTTTTKKPFICGNNHFQCPSGDCIFSSWVCDGMQDCPGGEDESHCDDYKNCTDSQFRCRMDGSCVPVSVILNIFYLVLIRNKFLKAKLRKRFLFYLNFFAALCSMRRYFQLSRCHR